METIEELQAFLTNATEDGIRGNLLDRGRVWSRMRIAGVMPEGAPPFDSSIETDLAEYGFALLRSAMALRSKEGTSELTSKAFEKAAIAFEALVRNGDPQAVDRGFYRTIVATAYHLAGFSTIAYSLFNETDGELNLAPCEIAVMRLILRDLDPLRNFVRERLEDLSYGDEHLSSKLKNAEIEVDDVVSAIVNTTICRALGYFDFALQTGEEYPLNKACELSVDAVKLANKAENVPLWWICCLCYHLIDDLWQHSLHRSLPTQPPEGAGERYYDLRWLFIGSLFARKNAEVELWPSQREAARRAADVTDDLVVALPTSAGKTCVAELAALMTLSMGCRVLIVTPLRALSAQTERSFRKTFGPLGFGVSSLYGASGLSSGDEDALRSREIVIATPEKLDFALRNDTSLINDIGLIILDEGHMIGPNEREIRYETLVQRLLRRSDSIDRRIVCLSAVLPSGQELDDLTAWIRADEPGNAVQSEWRPTRQRFGTLAWFGTNAQLTLSIDSDKPFINRFVTEKAALGREKKPYPRDNRDLTLFAAWEFAAQGKRTLIFSTQANRVEGYGKKAIKLCERGYLESLLDDETRITHALKIGREWLGEDHPAVASLKIGIAIHHGRLPSPFLRELELLLSEGVLKVIVASPTLAQGLNLNAAVLLVPTLYRAGQMISGEELANVAGRAGRAFIDVEGLIVHVMFDQEPWRRQKWEELATSSRARTLKSGLIQIVAEILERLTRDGVLSRDDAWEYLANSRDAWISSDDGETITDGHDAEGDEENANDASQGSASKNVDEVPLSQLIERLDTTVFGLIEALDADQVDLPKLLDEALNGSLWARQIVREGDDVASSHKKVLEARSRLIWKNTTAQVRRGHFAMGVGLEAGLAIDSMAGELEQLIDQADVASLSGDIDLLTEALSSLAERLLNIRPFIPSQRNALPKNWKDVLKQWISGADVSQIGHENMWVVEEAFIYRLVWALEAIRMRRLATGWSSDIITGGGVATLETGVPRFMMAMLIQAGLPSRRAAITAISKTDSIFSTPAEMREWLQSEEIRTNTGLGNWPTPETADLWQRFRDEALNERIQKWSINRDKQLLDLQAEQPPAGLYRIVNDQNNHSTWLMTPDYRKVAKFQRLAVDPHLGLASGKCSGGSNSVDILYMGQQNIRWHTPST